eukprot:scaffold1886_cov77-Isochrysis_galbana.AAC.1
MNWARSLSSKCWTVIAMRASTLAATRRLAGFGLEAWREVTSKWMGGSLSFSEGACVSTWRCALEPWTELQNPGPGWPVVTVIGLTNIVLI